MGLSGDILNSITEAVFYLDTDLRILYANRAAEEDLSGGGRTSPGTRLVEMLPWLAPYEETLRHAAAAGRSAWLQSLATPGGVTWARLTPCVRDGAEGGVVLTIGPLLQSPAERDNAAFESLDGMIAQIAHEINNPLAGIRGAAQLLAEQASPSSGEAFRVLMKEVDRLSGIVGELKGFAAQSALSREPLNIHEVLDHALSVIDPARRGVIVRRAYDPSLPEVCGNSGKLLQVLLNLFKNAVEAMEGQAEERVLIVRTRPSELYAQRGGRTLRWAEVSVADSGPGIDAERMEKIFLPFHTTKKGGSGLGLAISKKILLAHGGMLKAESPPAGGAVFRAFIPFAFSVPDCGGMADRTVQDSTLDGARP